MFKHQKKYEKIKHIKKKQIEKTQHGQVKNKETVEKTQRPRLGAPNHVVIGQHGQACVHFQDEGRDLQVGMQISHQVIDLNQTLDFA